MTKEISVASIADLEELILLLNVLFNQDLEFVFDYQKQKSGLEKIIENPEIGEILILKIDSKIAGMVSLLYSISTALGGKVAILEDMVIDEQYRKRSFGKALLDEAIMHAKRNDCLRITLLTDFDNDIAIRFYKQKGFQLSKMVPLRLVFD
jgi:ribosomal protein S18 acetylase RimI-like enzyme